MGATLTFPGAVALEMEEEGPEFVQGAPA